jgi:hypothetical protein
MRILAFRPANAWLRPKLDASWWRWFLSSLAWGGAAAALLVSAAAPRQERVRLAYEVAKLQEEVATLEREIQALELEKSKLMAPEALAQNLPQLALVPLQPERVLYLTPQGQLLKVAQPVEDKP